MKRNKLTKDETAFLKHIVEYGSGRGLTIGKGRPHDNRVIESLIAKHRIIGHRWEAHQPNNTRYFEVLSEQDDNGFRFSESYVMHHSRVVRIEDWDAIPESPAKMSASQNGYDTAIENGYKDHQHFDAIALAFAISTYELFSQEDIDRENAHA